MTCSCKKQNETKSACAVCVPITFSGSVKVGKFEAEATAIGQLVDKKNAAYGDSFARAGEIMRILYPSGISPEQMDDALAIVRVLDKLFRLATKKDAFGESPWRDIAGYAILGAVNSSLDEKLYKAVAELDKAR